MPGSTDDPTVRVFAAERVAGTPVTVFQWAQCPGPVGGVTRSVTDLSAALRRDGTAVRNVNTASPQQAAQMVPRLWTRRAVHLFHITRLWRATILAPLFVALPGRTVVVLHSGSTRRQLEALSERRAALLRRALHAYDEIWAVNDEIGLVLPDELATRVHVISPFVSGPPSTGGCGIGGVAESTTREPDLVTVSTNSGKDHYGADLAIEAMTRVRAQRPGLRLWILAYGDDGPLMDALRARIATRSDWIRLSFNLSPGEVADALIVREALASGARVIASDTAARPAGVELCALDAVALADAVLGRGRVSDGAGLAADSIVDAARAAVELVRR